MISLQFIPDCEGFKCFGFIKPFDGDTGMDQYIFAASYLIEQCGGKLNLHAKLFSDGRLAFEHFNYLDGYSETHEQDSYDDR